MDGVALYLRVDDEIHEVARNFVMAIACFKGTKPLAIAKLAGFHPKIRDRPKPLILQG